MGILAKITELATRPFRGRGPARADVLPVLKDEASSGARPVLPGAGFWGQSNSTPDLARMVFDVEAMLAHPRVHNSLSYYKAGIADPPTEVEDAGSPEQAAFAASEWTRFLQRCRSDAQRAYDYGRGGAEVVYADDDGPLRVDRLHAFPGPSVRPLLVKNDYVGLRAAGAGPAGDLDLWGPRPGLPAKGFWLTHNRRYSRWYGVPHPYPAWRPWRRLAGMDGAEDVIDGGVYRFAFAPYIGRYPPDDTNPPAFRPGDRPRSNRELMRQMLEELKSGASVALSSRRGTTDPNYVWDIHCPDRTLDVSGLIAYTSNLEVAISLGLGVPPELMEAAETGSGYSGRAIPLEAFLTLQQANAEALLDAWYRQIGRPLLVWNYGPGAFCRMRIGNLLEKRMSAGQKPPGQAQAPRAAGPGPLAMATRKEEGKPDKDEWGDGEDLDRPMTDEERRSHLDRGGRAVWDEECGGWLVGDDAPEGWADDDAWFAARPKAPKKTKEEKEAERLAEPPRTELNNRRPVEEVASWMFPSGEVTPETVHELGGAPDGAVGSATVHEGKLNLSLDHPHTKPGWWERDYRIDGDGDLVAHNGLFFLKRGKDGGGFSNKALGKQVQKLVDLGADRLETTAGRGVLGGRKMIGYLHWPKFGYDAPLPDDWKRSNLRPPAAKHLRAGLADADAREIERREGLDPKAALAKARARAIPLAEAETRLAALAAADPKSLLDLYESPEGQALWERQGHQINTTLDLKEGSRSLAVLNKRLARAGLPPVAPKDPEQTKKWVEARRAANTPEKRVPRSAGREHAWRNLALTRGVSREEHAASAAAHLPRLLAEGRKGPDAVNEAVKAATRDAASAHEGRVRDALRRAAADDRRGDLTDDEMSAAQKHAEEAARDSKLYDYDTRLRHGVGAAWGRVLEARRAARLAEARRAGVVTAAAMATRPEEGKPEHWSDRWRREHPPLTDEQAEELRRQGRTVRRHPETGEWRHGDNVGDGFGDVDLPPTGRAELATADRPPAETDLAGFDRPSRRLFGRMFPSGEVEPEEFHRLVGAQPGGRVRLGPHPEDSEVLEAEQDHPEIEYQNRQFQFTGRGGLKVNNDHFFLHDRFAGGGHGLHAFSDQVKHLADIGAEHIDTLAGRSEKMNGYLTWPKFGYEAPLRESILKKLHGPDAAARLVDAHKAIAEHGHKKAGKSPEEARRLADASAMPLAEAERRVRALRDAAPKTVQDLHETPDGEALWADIGEMMPMKFDLSEGSRSRRKLDEYRAKKGLGPVAYGDAAKARGYAKARRAAYAAYHADKSGPEEDEEDDHGPDEASEAEEPDERPQGRPDPEALGGSVRAILDLEKEADGDPDHARAYSRNGLAARLQAPVYAAGGDFGEFYADLHDRLDAARGRGPLTDAAVSQAIMDAAEASGADRGKLLGLLRPRGAR